MSQSRSDQAITVPDCLRLEWRDDIAFLSLNRPAKRNAVNDETIMALEAFFAAPLPSMRAVVLQGAGDHFCAGLDLSEIRERSVSEGISHSRLWHRTLDLIQFGQVPVIAVLHGAVVGGGLEIASAAHIRVAESSVLYALPEGQRGIFVGGGGSVRIPRLIGTARMMDMMLTGRTYSAAEGLQIGLSQYLVEPGAGLAKAEELARRVAGNAPMTNYALINVLPRISESGHAEGLMTETLISSIAQAEPEARKRVVDFLEKRAPKVEAR